MPDVLRFADLFCGGGGTTAGAEMTEGARAAFAVNHWDRAIETHAANFPHARHVQSRLEDTHPSECPPIDLLFASPECTHHSRARGGKPTSDQQRSGAWELMRWLDHHRPSFVVVENVKEFKEWGPVDQRTGRPLKSLKGSTFNAWYQAIRSYGYRVEIGTINAADHGAATSRDRLFVICRKGNRPAPWPEPTHCRDGRGGLFPAAPWRPAAEVIDWSIPCPSIFGRLRPLADKTLLRIEAGLRRFVEPFVVRSAHGAGSWGHRPTDLRGPLGTMTTSKDFAIAVPFVVPRQGFYEPHVLKRCRGVDEPLPTITASHVPGGIAVPYMVPFLGERAGQLPRSHSVGEPAPTVTTSNGKGLVLPFISKQFGTKGATLHGNSIGDPLGTVTTIDHHSVVLPFLASVNHGHAGETSGRTADLVDPLGTLTAKNGRSLVLPFLTQFYSSGGQWAGVDGPVPTIPTKDRHAVVCPQLDGYAACASLLAALEIAEAEEPGSAMVKLLRTMLELGVVDIGFRMLTNPELARAQGFEPSYVFKGTKSDVTRQIGNSVSPPVARAITSAILGV